MSHKTKIITRCFVAIIIIPIVLIFIAYLSGLRIFIIQPIGAIPDGRTLIVNKAYYLKAIDSPDAMCERGGSVTLICRIMAIKKVVDNSNILLRLPYNQILYNFSGAPETIR